MKRSERVSAIVKILSDSPNQSYSLGTFCQMFGAAKSSISEDLQAARNLFHIRPGFFSPSDGPVREVERTCPSAGRRLSVYL